MEKISSGIAGLDRLIDSLYIGDNVIWEVEAGTPSMSFVNEFIKTSLEEGQNVIYVSFNKSPQSVLQQLDVEPSEGFVLLDCFTSGKGNSDRTFMKFYDGYSGKGVRRVENPADVPGFTSLLNSIEDSLPPGARYVFDSLTGMQDLLNDDKSTYKFFTYMCPRLYDLQTVAYWILEKEAHDQSFKANLRHITQVVLELYKRKDSLYIKAHKLDGRHSREAFRPHTIKTHGDEITVSHQKKKPFFNIGSKIREVRTAMGMSQRDLAAKVDLTPSFISQLESNQLSPSFNSFIQICEALGISPSQIWTDMKPAGAGWLIRKSEALKNLFMSDDDMRGYKVFRDRNASCSIFIMEPGATSHGRFSHRSEKEFLCVLGGTVDIVMEGTEERLKAGDSAIIDHREPDYLINRGGEQAELMVFEF